MKKKRILTAAVNACVSLALFLNLFNVGVLGSVYAESEDNAERSNGELNEAKVNYGDEGSRYILLNQTETAESVIKSGDWVYFDRGDHISVCGYMGDDRHITIPSEIDEKKVTELSYCGNSYSSPRRFFDSDNRSGFSGSRTNHITIPETVTRIGERTFYECPCLERVDMPEGLISIGDSAFANCEQLRTAEIPSSVKTIGNRAFFSTEITSLSLPEGLEYIGDEAFFRIRIMQLEIPDTVKYIGYGAFSDTGITSLSLPEGLEYIGNEAFSYTDIEQLEIPDTVKYIGYGAFMWCFFLKSVKLPKDITVISEGLFVRCNSLRSVEIPEGVQVIEERAFASCPNLESIYIPSTVNVMSGILSDNPSLTDIYYAVDKETATALTGSDFISYVLYLNSQYEDYSDVQIHYGEKTEIPTENTAEENETSTEDNIVKIIFSVLAIIFSVTFIAALCLYALQKIKNRPKSAPLAAFAPSAVPIPQGNVLTSFNLSIDTQLCRSCKSPIGKNADYCIFCGKKLKGK